MIPAALAEKLSQCKTLPSLPAVVIQVIELARKPDTTSKALATAIEKDPSLSAKILSAAGSALYGGGDFSSLQQAINRIGMESALSLSLCFGLANGQKKGSEILNYFWKRALIAGLAVQEMHQVLKPTFNVDRVYLAAVLQDIGILALNAAFPERYEQVFNSARSHRQLSSFEEQTFGSNHLAVGAWLGKTWGLPEKYLNLIEASHRVPSDVEEGDLNTRVLALSGLLADPWVSGNQHIAMTLAYQASQDYLGVEEQTFSHLLLHIEEKMPNILRLFDMHSPEKIDTFNLLQEAKNLLIERNLRMMQKMAQQQTEIETLKKGSLRLQEQLKRDPLTGIFNRQYAEQKLEEYFTDCDQGRLCCLSVVFIDLDHFKQINDQYGHALGDSVLKAFAQVLEKELGSDCLAGRYGGEEFVALMPGFNQTSVVEFARRLQQSLASTPLLCHQQEDIYVSVSMGIAQHYPSSDSPMCRFKNAEALINAADQSMYQAKRSGRNQFFQFGADGIEDLSDKVSD